MPTPITSIGDDPRMDYDPREEEYFQRERESDEDGHRDDD